MAINHARDREAELLLSLARARQPDKAVVLEATSTVDAETPDDHPEEEKHAVPERHLWLFEVPKAKKTGKAFEGSAYFDRIPAGWKKSWSGKEIKKEDWDTVDIMKPDTDFRSFINSCNPRFDQMKPFLGFWLYCEQARRWEEEGLTLSDIPHEDHHTYKQQEYERIDHNKLYGLNKYVTVKEDGRISGRRDYRASTPQALLCYLIDLGFCFPLAKGRQAAITTTLLAIAALKAVVTQAFTGIFMVHKKDVTGKKLFGDKFRNTLQHLEPWIRAAWKEDGWSAERVSLDFDTGKGKGDKGRDTADFLLLSAEDDMVANGLTPTWSLFDEAQNIATCQKIVANLDPAMYQFDERTGRMELVRQVFLWGTGSSNNAGEGAFESILSTLFDRWNNGEQTDGWIPLFFDWTCRPGITHEFYQMMRRKYLRGQTDESKGLTPAERLALFSAHYPRTLQDCFMVTYRTIIPIEMVVGQQREIADRCTSKGLDPELGRFEPIYDTSIELPKGSLIAHPIIGSRWNKMPEDSDEGEAPIQMLVPPKKGYAHRYYQGTDPIENDGGFSRFSSFILDGVGPENEFDEDGNQMFFPSPVCMLNARTAFPQDLFLQNILMGMYYANEGQKACMELVEVNAGKRYIDFKQIPGLELGTSLLKRTSILPHYRGGTHYFGLDLKEGTKSVLYHDTVAFLREGHKRIWFKDVFTQITNTRVTHKANGIVTWGTRNKNSFNDDLLFALAYSDLCMRSVGKKPEKIDPSKPKDREVRVIKHDEFKNPYYEYERVAVGY